MPRNKYPEQTVEKILDAAAALFAEKGYQSTTLQDIIDATGLSKGAVYHHFRSKEEIARKVGDRMGDEMWEPLRRSQKRVLFVATGALMSQTTFLQKESIPAVAHLVELRAPEKESGA